MSKERGFINLIIIFVLVLIIISLLGISLGDIPEKNTLKENFSYLDDGIKYIWANFIQPYSGVAWDKIKDLIWEPLLKAAEKIRG